MFDLHGFLLFDEERVLKVKPFAWPNIMLGEKFKHTVVNTHMDVCHTTLVLIGYKSM
jgi:hypothetical protein